MSAGLFRICVCLDVLKSKMIICVCILYEWTEKKKSYNLNESESIAHREYREKVT